MTAGTLFSWLLATFFALLPALFWLIIWYRKDYIQPEPKALIAKAFLFGMLAILPFFAIQFMLDRSPNLVFVWNVFTEKSFFLATILLTMLLAGLEEFMKHFSVFGLGKKLDIYFDQIVDGIIYSVSAALGFAFMENILYFGHALLFAGISSDFWKVFIFRSFGTMLSHAIFSGIFGFLWGLALFSRKLTSRRRGFIRAWNKALGIQPRNVLIRSFRTKRPLRREFLREAFLLATCIHVFFNLLLVFELFGKTLTPFVAPLLLIGFVFLSRQFFVKKHLRIWKTQRA